MNKYAVLIGNSEFPDEPQLTQLRCPENDVTGMQEILAHPDLGGFNTVVPVINKALPEIIEEIHSVLNKAGKQDLVALYYSGHGKVSSKTSQLYLTAKNTRFASLPVTALAINQIRELISESDCNKVVLFLDCCYAGKAGNHKADIDSLLLTNTRGFYTLAASTGLQTSIEKEGDDYGLFTKHLIHGIKSGEADENGNGEITVDELYNYVYKKVLSENPNQVPTKSASDGRGELIISKSGRGSRKEKADKIKHYFIDLFKTDAIEIDILQDVSTLVYKLPQEFSANEQQRYDLFVEVFESKKLAGFDRKWDRLFTQDLSGLPPEKQQVNQNAKKEEPQASQKLIKLPNNVTLEMVYIPAGEFLMGSAPGETNAQKYEYPKHKVNVPAFYMAKYPLTQAQYQAVMDKTPSYFKNDKCPVENVSWNDAKSFCEKLSLLTQAAYRLPSEAEWEYACRAETTTQWHFGNNEAELEKYAWYSKNSDNKTHSVGEKLANSYGLYDMHGNVWEWCEDVWHDDYNGAPTDATAWISGEAVRRVLRGGAFHDFVDYVRCAARYYFDPDYRNFNFGFRVVLSPYL